MAEKIKLFADIPPLSLAELKAHFDAHPELWDKRHPDYGKPIGGIFSADYLTPVPRPGATPVDPRVYEQLRAFASKADLCIVHVKSRS